MGKALTGDAIRAAAEIAASEVEPMSDPHASVMYRRKMVKVSCAAQSQQQWQERKGTVMATLKLEVNGETQEVTTAETVLLLDALREGLGMTGD